MTELETRLEYERDKLAERLENVIELPKGFKVGQTVYMIPTCDNGLKSITAYSIWLFSVGVNGKWVDLGIKKKEKGVQPLYHASLDMFGERIFATYSEAEKALAERGGTC